MKKILLVTDDAYTYSGRERIFSLMNSIYAKDNEVTIVSLSGSGKTHYNFEGYKSFITLEGCNLKLYNLLKIIKDGGFDFVFLVSMGKLTTIFSIYIPLIRSSKTRMIACEHVSLESLGIVKGFLKRKALKLYHKVVVLTERDRVNLSTDKINDVVVIRNPIIPKVEVKSVIYKEAIAVGRLDEQKNFLELIDIWSYVVGKNNQWKLKIYGDGKQKEELLNKIKNKGMDDFITLMGRVEDMDSAYNKADICLMTSVFEGLPLALLEAKSHCLPAIAYDCPTGPAEIINNGVDGYLIEMHNKDEFAEKVLYLINNDERLLSFSNQCSKSMQEYKFEKIVKDWGELIS